MWSIHPDQITQIARAMTPDTKTLELAATIISEGMKASWGPLRIHERLHDRASYRYYWYLLERAHAQGITVPEEARHLFS